MNGIFNRCNYLWWIGVCAISPLVKAIEPILLKLESPFNMIGILPCYSLAYYILLVSAQYFALRSIARHLTMFRWFTIAIRAFLLYVSCWLAVAALIDLPPFFTWDEGICALAERIAGHGLAHGKAMAADWVNIAAIFIANGIAFAAFPAWALRKYTELRWQDIFTAAFVANCVTIAVSVILLAITGKVTEARPDLCPQPWSEITINIISTSIAGAIEGAMACMTLATLERKNDTRIDLQEPKQLLLWVGMGLALWIAICIAVRVYGDPEQIQISSQFELESGFGCGSEN